MLILSVDTSCATCRAGLWEDGRMIGETAEVNKKSHSVKLMPLIGELLEKAERRITDVDIFAPVNGPGSYTGLRIGVTVCKLLGYSAEKPVVTVNTLDFLARSLTEISDNTVICSCIDARNARVFYGIYVSEKSGEGISLRLLNEYDADSVDAVCEKIKEYAKKNGGDGVIVTGDGFQINKERFVSVLGDIIKLPKENELTGLSQAACDIAFEKFKEAEDKEVFRSENAEVFYLRMPHITVKKVPAE